MQKEDHKSKMEMVTGIDNGNVIIYVDPKFLKATITITWEINGKMNQKQFEVDENFQLKTLNDEV